MVRLSVKRVIGNVLLCGEALWRSIVEKHCRQARMQNCLGWGFATYNKKVCLLMEGRQTHAFEKIRAFNKYK